MDNYIVYMTINLVNGKYYIGVHKEGINNGRYLGSGLALQNAIKKYGRENFIRITLFSYPTQQEAYDKEKELVTPNLINDHMCYNICGGGYGTGEGESHPNYGREFTQEHKDKIAKSKIGDKNPQYGKRGTETPNYGRKFTQEHKYKIAKSKTGKKLSQEHKEAISNVHKGKTLSPDTIKKMKLAQLGKNNHMYGRTGELHPNYGTKHSSETKSKMSKVKSRKCFIKGILFDSGTQAAQHFNVYPSTISKWIKHPKKPDCYYIDSIKDPNTPDSPYYTTTPVQ